MCCVIIKPIIHPESEEIVMKMKYICAGVLLAAAVGISAVLGGSAFAQSAGIGNTALPD